ncbi:uncharacterized protein LOC116303712 [Actinia tenebrosa]|uniref:Uncharacterized protein LOC116303712 n=1 Tax=Actinia tenebrosa TaxID=6105 RepID=A0A6P8IQF2_ACTTE|nr:uncharacterized protein LOC116303712 [Actinia tenebrosa]
MARGLHHRGSSTDFTSSSEDEGCTKRKKKRIKNIVNIRGKENHVAVGNGANVSTTAESAGVTQNSFDVVEILKNPTTLLEAVAKCRGTEKDKIEKNILQHLLPEIENHAIKAASSCNDALELLARFCSPELKSPRLTIHSLRIMKRLLDLEFGSCESANAHIIEVERILRRSLVDGSFAENLQHIQRCRLEVYNSILALILLYLAKGHLKPPYINKTEKEEIKQTVTKNIQKTLQRNPRPKKDRWRFSMETVLNLIERLFDYNKLSRMTKLLDLCKDITLEAFLKKLQCAESSSVDYFVILKMLHGKLCTSNADAYQIIEIIIKNHDVFSKQWQRRNEDWKFSLLACQTLLHTINSTKLSKATRIKAAHCLASLMATKVYGKSEVIRNIIENHCIKTSFARDSKSRKVVIERRLKPELLDHIPLERDVMIKQICKIYESKGLECIEIIDEDENRVIVRGLYDYQPVAITVAIINPIKNLYADQDQDLSPSEKHLQNETKVLQHLNQTPNKHVLMVHTADTKTRPLHMICDYMPKEDLLHFLRVCKEELEIPTYRQLLNVCLGIANCMNFIHKKQVIHNQLRPEHVLLDDNFNVRITGFCQAKILSKNEMERGIHGEKLDLEDPSIRFSAPECLEDEPLFSRESDIWAFGVLMYVVFTCGGTPYANVDTKNIHQHVLSGRTLTKDMGDEVFLLIQKCMGKTRQDRISSFQKISEELQKLLAECDGKGADERLRLISEPLPKEDKDIDVMKNTPNTTKESLSLVDNSKQHLEKLRLLDHTHLARVVEDRKTKSGRVIAYENCEGPSLRHYILSNKCTPEDVIEFAAQITEAINYLHQKNIVLCVLNAESVRVVKKNHVKIFGLHFSRSILPSCNQFNTSFGVVNGEVHPDVYRWCAKEVIQEGIFSTAGDIWSLGMTILEMFLCLAKDADTAKPFSQYSNEEILGALKKNCRPFQPVLCPDWVYVLVTQCWCLKTTERASSLSVLDCLTQKCPWKSYLLQRWIKQNEIHENWPNLNVVQQLDETNPISRQDVESSVSEEFAGSHIYDYEGPFWLKKFKDLVISGKRFLMPSSRPPRSEQRPRLPNSPQETPEDIKHKNQKGKDEDDCDDTYDLPRLPEYEVTCPPRLRSASFPPLSLPPNSTQETITDIRQKEKKGEDDDTYYNIDDMTKLPEYKVTACPPRLRSASSPPLPWPPNSTQETITDTRQKEKKGEDNDIYDDTNDRPRLPEHKVTACPPRLRCVSSPLLSLPPNSPQETPTNIKHKEEKGKENDIYDDTYDRPRTKCLHGNSDQECYTPYLEPDESYQGLSYSTENGYMSLISNSSERIFDVDVAGFHMASTNNGAANNMENQKPVFLMNI